MHSAVRRQLLELYSKLSKNPTDPSGRTTWLTPVAVFVSTTLGFITIGEVTSAPLYVSLPNGIIIAFVMAGLSIACMNPGSDPPPDDPPSDGDDSPVLGSPGGPWTVVAHLGPPEPADRLLTAPGRGRAR
jgi:hypothetical protein